VPLFKKSFSYKELIDCAKGQLAGVDFPKLPLPPMLMFDEVTKIEETGGAYNKGTAHATYKITPDKWFFPCHFKDDPVMPGCLGMDALWQLLGFSLGNMGGRGKGRAISVGEVKFTGQILPTAKKVEYFLDFKRIIMRKLILGIADGRVVCDNNIVFEASDIRVGLFQD
jgi:3-hydroxyacyl-[acyl-carrier protein] dehydratase/trans-2-decenoyl-[acyl-carrier protein] isomerase